MAKIISFFAGKKTYIVAIVGITYGLLHGDNQIVLDSILAMTLRAGISKK